MICYPKKKVAETLIDFFLLSQLGTRLHFMLFWLVVEPTPLKNMSSSDWIIIPNLAGGNKIHVPNHQAIFKLVKPKNV